MKRAIDWLLFLIGLAVTAVGADWMWTGWDIVQVERGWAKLIAGAALASGGLVTMAVAWAVVRLTPKLRQPPVAASAPQEAHEPQGAHLPHEAHEPRQEARQRASADDLRIGAPDALEAPEPSFAFEPAASAGPQTPAPRRPSILAGDAVAPAAGAAILAGAAATAYATMEETLVVRENAAPDEPSPVDPERGGAAADDDWPARSEPAPPEFEPPRRQDGTDAGQPGPDETDAAPSEPPAPARPPREERGRLRFGRFNPFAPRAAAPPDAAAESIGSLRAEPPPLETESGETAPEIVAVAHSAVVIDEQALVEAAAAPEDAGAHAAGLADEPPMRVEPARAAADSPAAEEDEAEDEASIERASAAPAPEAQIETPREPAPESVRDEEPPPAPSVAPPSESAVVGRYSSGDTNYLMFADGSIEAQTPEGVMRFASLVELRRFVEQRH